MKTWFKSESVDFLCCKLTYHLLTFQGPYNRRVGPAHLVRLVLTIPSSVSLSVLGDLQKWSSKLLPILMDFEVDGDVNGEVAGNSVDVEGSAGDENVMAGSSVARVFQQNQDDKVSQDLCGREMVIVNAFQAINNSASVDEPYLGQEFDSEAEAHAFYNAYATRVGFIIRVSKLSRSRRDGSAIGRALVCNKEGFRMPDKREKIVRQRAETRVGCRAMILVRKVSSGKWVVTKFVKEHTHPLTPGKGRRDLIYDQYPNEHDKIRELSQQLAVEKKRAATYKRHLEMVFEHIEEHNQSLSKKIEDIVDSVREIESKEKQSRR